MIYLSLSIYFIAMLAIGVFAYKTSTQTMSDYALGGRNVSPYVTALSAGASDMSGWMLMGLPGAMFIIGFEATFIAIGLMLGALANYLLVAPRLRVFTQLAKNSLTIPEYLANRFGSATSNIRIISASIIVVFFTLYTSAGLVAGGKLFESVFGLSYHLGLIITLGVVVSYTSLGGFLAVSLTDFVQGCIMFVALILVPIVAFQQFNNTTDMLNSAYETIPSFSQATESVTTLAIISSLSWGLGYFGQPHIIVRFMAINSLRDIPVARNIGMSWMTVTIIGALATGLIGVAYANKFGLNIADPETIFIIFSDLLFHPLISGFLMAAILAAIMSTISSQLLVSASSLTEDIFSVKGTAKNDNSQSVKMGRYGVAGISLVALLFALDKSSSILSLVSHAWAGFGAAFGPLILFSLYKQSLTYNAAISGMLTGAFTVLVWVYVPVLPQGATLSSVMYEMIPGFVASSLVIATVSRFGSTPSERTQLLFSRVERLFTTNA